MHNSTWLNKSEIGRYFKKSLKNDIVSENDANCFALSESYDGSAKHYKIVFGIILGSGCGGGLVINKKILVGPNGLAGEWRHIGLPIKKLRKLNN